MTPHEKQQWIEQLLAEGQLTQRQIAAKAGVSRYLVQSIAQGRSMTRSLYISPLDDEPPPVEAVRCSTCGGLVYPPCRLCQLRSWQRQQRMRRARARPSSRTGNCRRAADCSRGGGTAGDAKGSG